MASDGTIKITTDLDNEAAKKAMSKFSNIASTGLKGVSIAVAAVSTALVGAAGYAIKTGIDFESAFAGVKKTVNATEEEMSGFRQGIRDMAKEMPQSASAIAEVAEAAGQLGIKNESLLSFTEVMANLGVATNMSATDAATSLARLANITQMPQENFDRLGSTIVALGNNLATTESEITEMGLRLAGAGAQVGMSEAQIMGLAGAISSVGIEADAGGSAVSTVMAKMQLAVEKGGDSLGQFADVAGMSAEQFQQAFRDDAAQALVSFVTGLGTMESRGQSAIATLSDMEITEIRQRDALLRLSGAGDILSESLGIATQAWDENNALTKEAEQRYETMESRIQILKNNITDLGIGIYDSMRDPIKNTVDEGITYVEKLSEAFSDGGLKGVVSATGEMFAEIATNAAEQAPAMVESAVDFIQAFATGIYNNRSELISAAGSMATALADGLTELLPASIGAPVKEAVDGIAESFESGGLKSAVKTVADTIENLGNVAGSVAMVTLPPLTKAVDLLGDNTDKIVPSFVAGYTAIKTYGAVTKIATSAAKAHAASTLILNKLEKANALQLVATNGGLTVRQALTAVYNGQIGVTTALTGLWTKAQIGLNAALTANPIGLVVAAVAALAAGIGAVVLLSDDATEKTYGLSTAEKENLTAVRECTDQLNTQREAREESIASIDREYSGYGALLTELQSVTDANGNIKAGYEDRAKVITGQLSEALGIEIGLLDGQIQKYGEVVKAIEEVILKKEAEAVLSSMQDDMTNAYKKTEDAINKYKEAASIAAEKDKEVAALTKDVENAQRDLESATGDTAGMYPYYNEQLTDAEKKLKAAKNAQKDATKEAIDAKSAMEELSSEVNNYRALQEAVASNDTAKMQEALNTLVTSYRSYTSEALSSSEETKNSLYNQAKGYVDSLGLIQDGTIKVADEIYGQMADAAVKTIDNFNKLPDGIAQGIKDIGPEASAAMISALEQADIDGKLSEESKASYQAFLDGLSALPGGTRTSILAALEPMLSETEFSKIQMMINGQNAGEGYADGVSSKTDVSTMAGKANADAVIFGAGTTDMLGIGANVGSLYALGVCSKSFESGLSGLSLSNTAESGAGSVNPSGTGAVFGTQYASGVGSKAGESNSKGQSLADNAESGAGTGDGYTPGSNFGSGFVSGIGDWIASAAGKAAELASSAFNAAKRWLDEHSPSRKTRKLGKWFSQGLGLGIEDDEKYAISAAESMSDNVLGALDIDAMSTKLKGMDISSILESAYSAIDEKHNVVADRIVTEVEVKSADRTYQNRKQEQEIMELTEAVTKLTKLANRPVIAKFYVGTKEMAREIAMPVNDVIQNDAKLKSMIRGVRQ